MSRMSSESGSEESDSEIQSGMPMGGMHITMGPGGFSVNAAPGLPVDMATGGPLIQAVMAMLAKKDAENQLINHETQPEVGGGAEASSSTKKEDDEKEKNTQSEESKKKKKKSKKRGKFSKKH